MKMVRENDYTAELKAHVPSPLSWEYYNPESHSDAYPDIQEASNEIWILGLANDRRQPVDFSKSEHHMTSYYDVGQMTFITNEGTAIGTGNLISRKYIGK